MDVGAHIIVSGIIVCGCGWAHLQVDSKAGGLGGGELGVVTKFVEFITVLPTLL